ncbi:50S ribosomal protein L5 [Candidatus Kaiserbacteria bacterium RIFCSPLOWO2_01_FULL_53_17]|uniref:Large ribosomal subunit protein uL5 n=1 Tax=Candidatus Kaiserbacteria bacterium RIFCSPLOWO2_01_FULL_53_17 TaxID=1798511 RepID=A0A1F6EHZ1_9BACT|nr:MAG: 50S ribosomal protein L5 [Candidatus Kaiserbacteria bacterium RIFCSPLOWO2_01_FULL_53_17]
MKTHTTAEKLKNTFTAMKGDFHYKSPMQAPHVEKIVVSTGVGSVKDKKRLEMIENRITRITGQKPSHRATTKSIANFKTRRGDLAGYQVTLRGARMQNFLDKLVNIVYPRVRDFRGIPPKAIDEMGNITLGFKEHTVFPETADEEAKDIFGLAVTIGTTAKNKKEAEVFLRHLGIPLRS